MRELPEPDGDHDRVFDRGTVVYKKESVLAIQKQAYEDGLRDAAWRARAEQLLSVHVPDDAPTASGSFRAMLTASQKEQQ